MNYDIVISHHLCNFMHQVSCLRLLKRCHKLLEHSCSGIWWILACFILLVYSKDEESMKAMLRILIFGLIVNVIAVGVLKAVIRRRRPKIQNFDFPHTNWWPFVYSFPSKQVARATFIAYFFIKLYPKHFPIFYESNQDVHEVNMAGMTIWILAVSIVRIMLRRLYLLDVLGGLAVGFLNGCLLSILYY